MGRKPTNPKLNRAHPLARGLVGAWPVLSLDASELLDLTGANDLASGDSPSKVYDAHIGIVARLDASGFYSNAAISASSPLRTSTAGSVSVWFRADSTSSYDAFAAMFANNGLNQRWWLGQWSTGVLRFQAKDTGGVTRTTDAPSGYADGEWHHAVGTFENGDYVRLYVDGALVATSASTLTTAQDCDRLDIGTWEAISGYAVDGDIADTRIWDRALSAAEIVDLYRNPWGLYAQRKRRLVVAAPPAAGNVSVTPTVATVALAGGSPSVVAGSLSLTPAAGSVTLTGTSPSVSEGGLSITPAAGAVTLGGSSPTVSAGSISLTPGAASLALAGTSPTVTEGGNLSITPAAASVALTGTNPTPILGSLVLAAAASVVALLGVDPSVSTGGPLPITPAAASVTLAGVSPSVGQSSLSVTPATGGVTLGAADPATSVGGLSITPAAASAVLSASIGSITLGSTSSTPAAAVVALGAASPSISGGADAARGLPGLPVSRIMHTVNVSRAVQTISGMEKQTGMQVVDTIVPCLIQPISSAETISMLGQGADTTWEAHFDGAADIQPRDELEWIERSMLLEVLTVQKHYGRLRTQPRLLSAVCKRVGPSS